MLTKSSIALTLLKHSSKTNQTPQLDSQNHPTDTQPTKKASHQSHCSLSSHNESNHSNTKDSYFLTSDSDSEYFLSTEHTIIEKTPDNSYGRFNELLGSGSFKQVYRGYDFNQGREIAWSIINPSHQNLSKITEEITILKQLNHPNIIHFITGWLNETSNQVIIITELVSGGSLRNNLKRIKDPRLRLVKKWIREILEGLSYLHKKNIVHRDIKCDNIFLDSISGNVKIGDLGGSEVLCKKYGSNYVGTQEFMAPEVHEGKYTVKADIYSLGMSIIEMLTLEKPYKECDGPMVIYYNITHGIYPESLGKIENEEMVKFIKMCLMRENERPSAEEILMMNDFLNDTTSEENDYPVNIKDRLRLENIGKNDSHRNEVPIIRHDDNNEDKQKKPLFRSELNLASLSSENRLSPVSTPTNGSRNNIKRNTASSSSSSFVITIKESDRSQLHFAPNPNPNHNHKSTTQLDHTDTNNYADFSKYHSSSNESITPNEVEISFVISKETWKNKSKQLLELTLSLIELLKCPYSLDNDTVDGLASELKSAIDLDDEEFQIVREKLNESINKYTSSSALSSRRTSMNHYDTFQSSYNNLIEHIKVLMNNEETKHLEEMLQECKDVDSNDIKAAFINRRNFLNDLIKGANL